MKFGISGDTLSIIISTLREFAEIKKASVFGSRALGNYKNGSDIDLVVFGPEVTTEIINLLSIKLNEELSLPYYFDVIHYETLDSKELKEHVDTFAKGFYP
ncbi:Nucleotidyltransferase domain-containing protein [Desulfonispora thiosulfatigenes DSM 11270]|uniref:Nucleotidyltransferase domain-containing protein n=1 Tax=Desulfonispora thiosulfatigenes DSM 11270 TaxID=656914 RepID=A0A1W1UXL8_DESTI|nr:nucleotidyltransferase domain-containing protein [Desulfonispora thiosulfatigenes]SMB85837.1 Nucleotidyltransferase domain-containing protein [Desulfonispora thiosulfatigenes DSM 11270]